jgi:hypothetical protein
MKATRTVVVFVEIEGEEHVLAEPERPPPKYQEEKPDIVVRSIKTAIVRHAAEYVLDIYRQNIRIKCVDVYNEDGARDRLCPPNSSDWDDRED